MTETITKFPFVSMEWLEVARSVLEEVVAEHGEDGVSFSASEMFTDASGGLAGPEPTTATWHFRIEGKTATGSPQPPSPAYLLDLHNRLAVVTQ